MKVDVRGLELEFWLRKSGFRRHKSVECFRLKSMSKCKNPSVLALLVAFRGLFGPPRGTILGVFLECFLTSVYGFVLSGLGVVLEAFWALFSDR